MLRLIGLFSILALGLAMLGVYGVMAESVAQRVPEIGIRVGARRHSRGDPALVIAQAGWMVVLGLAWQALAGALALRRAMSTLVFGVPTTDPVAYVIACACLAVATIAACAIPANRAASLDPIRRCVRSRRSGAGSPPPGLGFAGASSTRTRSGSQPPGFLTPMISIGTGTSSGFSTTEGMGLTAV